MRLFITTILAAFVTVSTAWSNGTHFLDSSTNQITQHFNCDVNQSKASAHFKETIRNLHRNPWKGSRGGHAAWTKRQLFKQPTIVQTYFHILTKNASAGSITPIMVTQQLLQLNSAYNPSGFIFNLVNTTYTANDAWAVAAGANMTALKRALRRGSYSALNLYFHTDLANNLLGTCTLPSQVYHSMTAAQYAGDGCNVHAHSMPGGTLLGYNQGKTAVHEVGHWLGLLHTFEGDACTGAGDFIADTPQEAASTNGCPVKPPKDSCPGVAGVDPIHNYMDYSTDACYTSFTPLQSSRMQALWQQYRAGM